MSSTSVTMRELKTIVNQGDWRGITKTSFHIHDVLFPPSDIESVVDMLTAPYQCSEGYFDLIREHRPEESLIMGLQRMYRRLESQHVETSTSTSSSSSSSSSSSNALLPLSLSPLPPLPNRHPYSHDMFTPTTRYLNLVQYMVIEFFEIQTTPREEHLWETSAIKFLEEMIFASTRPFTKIESQFLVDLDVLDQLQIPKFSPIRKLDIVLGYKPTSIRIARTDEEDHIVDVRETGAWLGERRYDIVSGFQRRANPTLPFPYFFIETKSHNGSASHSELQVQIAMYCSLRILLTLETKARTAASCDSGNSSDFIEPRQEMRRVFGISTNGPHWHLWVMRVECEVDSSSVDRKGKGKAKEKRREVGEPQFAWYCISSFNTTKHKDLLQVTLVIKYIMEEAERRLETIGNWLWCLRKVKPRNHQPPPQKKTKSLSSVSISTDGQFTSSTSTQASKDEETVQSSDHLGPPERPRRVTRSNSSSASGSGSASPSPSPSPSQGIRKSSGRLENWTLPALSVSSHPSFTKFQSWDLFSEEERQEEVMGWWIQTMSSADRIGESEDIGDTSKIKLPPVSMSYTKTTSRPPPLLPTWTCDISPRRRRHRPSRASVESSEEIPLVTPNFVQGEEPCHTFQKGNTNEDS